MAGIRQEYHILHQTSIWSFSFLIKNSIQNQGIKIYMPKGKWV